MKYYIITGEASGDLYASNLMKSIKLIDSQSTFRFWGGDLMNKESENIVRHYKDYSIMGFLNILLNIKDIFNNLSYAKRDILEFNPDCIILVDFPGFNFKIAKFAKISGYKVYYYISPQLWAWHKGRIKFIKKYIDKMFVIYPFEKDFYKKLNYSVKYFGHPMIKYLSNEINKINNRLYFGKYNKYQDKPIISLLPGSRKSEIKYNLKRMLLVVDHFPNFKFVVAGLSSIGYNTYYEILIKLNLNNVELIIDNTYELLKKSYLAIVCSGTATLETALLRIPQIVCYRTDIFSYFLAKLFINKNLKYISIVNIILKTSLLTELIQFNFNSKNLINEIKNINVEKIIKGYDNLFYILNKGVNGNDVSFKIADYIFKDISHVNFV